MLVLRFFEEYIYFERGILATVPNFVSVHKPKVTEWVIDMYPERTRL